MSGKACSNCHDGSIATGKTPTHLVTSQDCSACHTTVGTFATNATGFDHTGIVSGCQNSGCHASGNANVTDVTDDPNTYPHIPIQNNGTEVDCINCHKSPGGTFANASMNHTVVSFEACESCHTSTPTKYDGANSAHIVTVKPSTHFVTSITKCASCHTSTTAWTTTATSYKHTGSGYPGDHNKTKVTSCSQCHKDNPANANISTFPSATYGSTCAVCHLSQYKSGHGGTPSASKQNCGSCHSVSGSRFDG